MRVKRYVVDSMPDALQKIRIDLGKDAVILNTKEIRSGGFLGLFSKKKIEVIAAIDSAAAPRTRREPARAAANALTQAAFPSQVAVLDEPPAADIPPVQPPRPAVSAGFAQAQAAYRPQSAVPSAPERSAEPPDSPDPAPAVASLQPGQAAKPAAAADNDELLKELRAMKQMMAKLASGTAGSVLLADPVLEEIQERLLDQEIAPELAERIVRAVEEQFLAEDRELTREAAVVAVKDQLRIILGSNTQKALAPDTRIAHFVGPTGVGKTTTIAKLAAEQTLKYRRKVGLITSDTYRIAAVEQLKTYATILNVPLEVVFSPLDLKKALDRFKDCDIVFMDTAGRNYRNEMYVSELNALLQTGGKSETFLVMSLTTKYKDMKAITENFSKFKLDKVLFTKMDETDTYGSLVNLMNDFPLQLSYMTNGQNVPDDFAVADENEIINLIMGEQSDE